MNSWALACRAAATTSSWAGSGSPRATWPYTMFSRIVPAKSTGSCMTTARLPRNHAGARCLTSTPSTLTVPSDTSYHRWMSESTVLFPLPLWPTRAVVLRTGHTRSMPLITGSLPSPYANVTPSNSTSPVHSSGHTPRAPAPTSENMSTDASVWRGLSSMFMDAVGGTGGASGGTAVAPLRTMVSVSCGCWASWQGMAGSRWRICTMRCVAPMAVSSSVKMELSVPRPRAT
mmetsp:Transcript_18815/g.63765  ORF Transcript_18815/g.63765 Transcript_18815/m.63765 type:complete len:231 (-) Transcript_18815:1174-1866(-)